MKAKKVVVAVSGASGALYTKVLFDKLKGLSAEIEDVGIVMSANARDVWMHELGDESYKEYGYRFYDSGDFKAPFASGSAKYELMIICPCSMGTLGRIAAGISNDLVTRAADVILKERRKLIAVVRETPYNLIHINNMKAVTEAGGIVCPASPSFYSLPSSAYQVAETVIDRVLDLAGFDTKSYRWGAE